MKEVVTSHIWWVTLLLGLAMLVSHVFGVEAARIDSTAIILLVVIALSPFVSAITKIKFGDLEAEIGSDEVREITQEVESQAGESDKALRRPVPKERFDPEPGFGEFDPVLAIARLRVEFEDQLRALYRAAQIEEGGRTPVSVKQLLRGLTKAEVLDPQVAKAIARIIEICNRAIHGEEIRHKDASAVFDSGTLLLAKLGLLTAELRLDPVESVEIQREAMDAALVEEYQIETIVPYADAPKRNTYVLSQDSLTEFLEDYAAYGEFIVKVDRVHAEESA